MDYYGDYVVTVQAGPDEVLVWSGYAENISEALYKTLELREEEHLAEQVMDS